MLKAAKKKLKFWSKKKKAKQTTITYHFPPPLPCHCCTCNCSPATQQQPSAPPLPPWLDDQNQIFPTPSMLSEEPALDRAEIITVPFVAGPSYQQYLAPEPVYGVPIIVQTESSRERWRRRLPDFGCFGDLGIKVLGWFCPCFRIPQPYYILH